jgi:hypothetical protein
MTSPFASIQLLSGYRSVEQVAETDIATQNLGSSTPHDSNTDAPAITTLGQQLTSYASIVSAFMEHLECAIHTIIYERDIYPQELFMNARKYNSPAKMCRIPKVNQYVRHIADIVGNQLLEVCECMCQVCSYSELI